MRDVEHSYSTTVNDRKICYVCSPLRRVVSERTRALRNVKLKTQKEEGGADEEHIVFHVVFTKFLKYIL